MSGRDQSTVAMDHIIVAEHSTSMVGPKAVDVFRLAVLVNGLKLEIRCPGMKLSRHGSALAFAKQITGLKTNDRRKHLERVELMLEQAKREVLYVEEEKS